MLLPALQTNIFPPCGQISPCPWAKYLPVLAAKYLLAPRPNISLPRGRISPNLCGQISPRPAAKYLPAPRPKAGLPIHCVKFGTRLRVSPQDNYILQQKQDYVYFFTTLQFLPVADISQYMAFWIQQENQSQGGLTWELLKAE